MKQQKIINSNKILTNTEEYLVNFINKNPDFFITQTSNEIAKQANVSPSALTRLSKKLGYRNLKAFQITVAYQQQEFINQNFFEKEAILKNQVQIILNQFWENLEISQVPKIINKILEAKKIYLFQTPDNRAVIDSLTFKLEKIGFEVITNENFSIQLLTLSKLTKKDLVLFFGTNFNSKKTTFILKKVHDSKLPLVIITNQKEIIEKNDNIIWFNWRNYPTEDNPYEIDQQLLNLIICELIYQQLNHQLAKTQQVIFGKGNAILEEWKKSQY